MSTTLCEQKNTASNERTVNGWTDNREWCTRCSKEKNKLEFDNQTKTTRCPQCEHIETYTNETWKTLQTQIHVTHQYMPGKYLFANLQKEEIIQTYLREHNHIDWSSWLIHDYVLARMRNDKIVQEKLKDASKLIVEKMNYDPKPWQTLFEKMDAQNPEIFHQVPQILYEYAEKKLQEAANKENLTQLIRNYLTKLTGIYCYNRWKNDRVTCWITSENIKLCNVDHYTTTFYTKLFNCDPMIDTFQEDLLTGKKYAVSAKESYIQWQLRQADTYLNQSSIVGAVQAAYEALGTKLGVHDIWPPNKRIPLDIHTVKKVSQLFNDLEFFRLYNLSTTLSPIDSAKAHYYARLFIEKVKEMLPEVTSIEQEQAKHAAYIS